MKLNVYTVAGLALMLFGLVYPMVTLVIDTSPPVAALYYPDVGKTYTAVKYLEVYVKDPESGIKLVECTIQGTKYTLQKYMDYQGYEIYRVYDADFPDLTMSGEYSVSWRVVNKAGLETTKSGTFTIYIDLQGEWYVNDILITEPTQIVYLTTTTVTFKFVKTQGIEDSKILCWVEEGGTRILDLTYQGNGVWQGSYTFSEGTHSLTLVAKDPWKSINMAIVQFEIPGEGGQIEAPSWINMQTILIILGGCLAAYGFYKGEKRGG